MECAKDYMMRNLGLAYGQTWLREGGVTGSLLKIPLNLKLCDFCPLQKKGVKDKFL